MKYEYMKIKNIFMEIENILFEDILLVQYMKHENNKYCTIYEIWK